MRAVPVALTRQLELPCGLEIDGELHVDIELSPLTMRESMEYETLAKAVPEGMDADEWRALCRIASMTRKLGTLPRDRITTELLLDAAESDVIYLSRVCNELVGECASFRGGRGRQPGLSDAGSQRDGLERAGADVDA